MLHLVALVVLLAAASVRAQGTCASDNELAKPEANSRLTNCEWYFGSSCCKRAPDPVAEEFERDFPTRRNCEAGVPTEGCLEMLNLFNCGRFCSPNQRLFFVDDAGSRANGNMRICKQLVDAMWDACKAGVPTDSGCSGRLDSIYNSADEWVKSSATDGGYLGLNGQVIESNVGCFNAAPRVAGGGAAAVAAAVAAAAAAVTVVLAAFAM